MKRTVFLFFILLISKQLQSVLRWWLIWVENSGWAVISSNKLGVPFHYPLVPAAVQSSTAWWIYCGFTGNQSFPCNCFCDGSLFLCISIGVLSGNSEVSSLVLSENPCIFLSRERKSVISSNIALLSFSLFLKFNNAYIPHSYDIF